jgi:hypothetical protein
VARPDVVRIVDARAVDARAEADPRTEGRRRIDRS